MYSLTIFKNKYDNKTEKRMDFGSWSDFSDFLYNLSLKPNTKAKAPLISPAVYPEDTTRANRNVSYWASWAAMDVDSYEPEDIQKLDDIEYEYIIYSTASSTKEHPKFRMVFPLTSNVDVDDIKHFWHSLNSEILNIGDAQTKDLSRMYYIPAQYEGAFSFYNHKNKGSKHINPQELMLKYDRLEKTNNNVLPPELQAAVEAYAIEQAAKGLDNQNISWSSYRDCRFWPSDLAAEYMVINETGWYLKMYQIMVKIAGAATFRGYPITATEIEDLCREFDKDTGDWYKNRPMHVEAERARGYVLYNSVNG